jgi:glycosyltransferase involved in cell wall biosynthesis
MSGNSISEADKSYVVSVVVPVYNEEESIRPLVKAIDESLKDAGFEWELLLVNDGSSDRTLHVAMEVQQEYGKHIRLIALQRNFGQTAAMQAGIEQSVGDYIVTLDGDLQNDPADISRMVERLIERDLDLLVGWRKDRKDNMLIRKVPSRIANWLIGKATGVKLNYYGCSLKVYRGSVIRNVKLYGEMHRFIPAWVAIHVPVERIEEVEVNHHARQFGESKYTLSRVYRVILDLISVIFFMRFRTRPSHFFGPIGMAFGGIGTLMMLILGVEKFLLGEEIGGRPMLIVGVLLIVMAIQFITTGILAEIMSRTYYESSNRSTYEFKEIVYQEPDESEPDSATSPEA